MGYVNKVVDNVGTHLVEPTLYTAAGGTAAAYTAAISTFELVEGVMINLKIPTTNAASATLSINNTTAKNIYYNNAAIAEKVLKANHIYNLTYDGTNWVLVGDLDAEVNITNTSLPSSGNKIYYLTYSVSTTTGNQKLNNSDRLYLYENTTDSYLAVGSGSTSGGLTIRNKNGKYMNIVTSAFSDNQTLTLPDKTGIIALTGDIPTKVSQLTNDSGYVKSSGVTSITLKAGAGITLDTDNTAITNTGERTISISGLNTSSGSTTKWLNQKGGWSTPTAAQVGAAPAVTGGYLPLSGGAMTGNIRRYYDAASTEPMITMLSNNLDIILWEAGHGAAAAATTTSNHYKLLYKGTGYTGNNENYLQLIAHKSDDNIAVQIDEAGKIILPQMATGAVDTPIYINSDGVITAGTKLGASAYHADSYFALASHGTHVTAATVKSALGTVTTTAKKFLKDTGAWAQVNWSDLSGVPDTFTPETHTHNSDNTLMHGYTRSQIGTSPNYDNPQYDGKKINGIYEIRKASEVSGQTGTRPPAADYYPMLSLQTENVMMQLGGSNSQGWFIRGKQAANVTLANVDWQQLITDANYKSYAWARPSSIASGQILVSNGAAGETTLRGIYTLSTTDDTGWSTTANRTKIPDMSFMAYWNGAYNGTSSNLSVLGTITTGTWNASVIESAYIDTAIARLASPAFTGTPTAPTAEDGTNNTQIATTAFVMNAFKTNDAMLYKGVINADSDLPTTHYQGWTYKVGTAGKYAGIQCEVGDMIICNTDGTTANNAHWNIIQTNIDGAVTSSSDSSTDNALAVWSGTSGRIIKNQSYVTYLNHSQITGKNFYQDGLLINGVTENGTPVFGDAGPQLQFNDSGQQGSIIFTRFDNGFANSASWHFVANQSSGTNVTSTGFTAKTYLTIGQNALDTDYNLSVTGTTKLSGNVNVISNTPRILFKEMDADKSVAPSSATQQGIFFTDQNGATLGLLDQRIYSESNRMEYLVLEPNNNTNVYHGLRLYAPFPVNNTRTSAYAEFDAGSYLKLNNDTDATAADTGALRVLGGASISKSLYAKLGIFDAIQNYVIVDRTSTTMTAGEPYTVFQAKYKNTTGDGTATISAIRVIGTDEAATSSGALNNGCVLIGSGTGCVWFSAGESSSAFPKVVSYNDENAYISADAHIEFYSSNSTNAANLSTDNIRHIAHFDKTGTTTFYNNMTLEAGSITANAGNIFSGTDSANVERDVGVKTTGGDLYLYSTPAGNRGLYTHAHGTGAAKNIISIDTNNNATFAGHSSLDIPINWTISNVTRGMANPSSDLWYGGRTLIDSSGLTGDLTKRLYREEALIETNGNNSYFFRTYNNAGTTAEHVYLRLLAGPASTGINKQIITNSDFIRVNSDTDRNLGREFRATRGTRSIEFGFGTAGVNRGIYDTTLAQWVFYSDDSNTYLRTVLPLATETQDLGSATYKWQNLYTKGIQADTITITDTNAVRHLRFSRTGWNYITAPKGGSLAFSVGDFAGTGTCPLLITGTINDSNQLTAGALFAGLTSVVDLGRNTNYFKTAYINTVSAYELLYLNSGSNTKAIVFQQGGTERARINTKGHLQVNTKVAQDAFGILANDAIGTTSRYSFTSIPVNDDATAQTVNEHAYMQYNTADDSIDFIFN